MSYAMSYYDQPNAVTDLQRTIAALREQVKILLETKALLTHENERLRKLVLNPFKKPNKHDFGMTAGQANIFYILMQFPNQVVPFSEIISIHRGNYRASNICQNTLAVFVSKIRAKLPPHMSISVVRGVGYKLEIGEVS